jgi:hypothetical protein
VKARITIHVVNPFDPTVDCAEFEMEVAASVELMVTDFKLKANLKSLTFDIIEMKPYFITSGTKAHLNG